MSDFRFAAIGGLVGVMIGLGAFFFNYHMVPISLPGYEILAAPAMFVLSFFSEETYFTEKMILFLFGQFGGYFLICYLARKIYRRL